MEAEKLSFFEFFAGGGWRVRALDRITGNAYLPTILITKNLELMRIIGVEGLLFAKTSANSKYPNCRGRRA